MNTKPSDRLLLVGCGILKRELLWLIEKNCWPLDTLFLDSTLHIHLDRLEQCLKSALAANQHRRIIVFYGCCHPRMETMLKEGNTSRMCGQNCVDMLLGPETFHSQLEKGAFFLLEDWAGPWREMLFEAFGTRNLQIVRDIFRGDRTFVLGIRTPCSLDFSREAAAAGEMVGLPVQWMDVSLDHLESVLQVPISQRMKELA